MQNVTSAPPYPETSFIGRTVRRPIVGEEAVPYSKQGQEDVG